MSEDQKKQLQKQLWNIANELRGKMKGDAFELSGTPLSKIPIASGTPELRRLLESHVREIVAIKSSNTHIDTSSLESQIDQVVYKLYQLTPEEVKIIESIK